MRVELLAYTPQPEKVVAAAAKLCYSSSGVEDIMEGLDEQKTKKFLDNLMDLGHESPLEHMSFTFGIEGVSRSFLAQITRHRIASYSVKSQRYVNESQFAFVTPPEIEQDEQARAIFWEAMRQDAEQYNRLADILKKKHKQTFLKAGMGEKEAERKAEKKAIEDARYVLPNSCETKMVATFNARSLLNFFKHRCCNRAQWEIRACAVEMLRLVKQVAPTVFAQAGPPCLNGPCPEGKMSCGEAKQMREFYANL